MEATPPFTIIKPTKAVVSPISIHHKPHSPHHSNPQPKSHDQATHHQINQTQNHHRTSYLQTSQSQTQFDHRISLAAKLLLCSLFRPASSTTPQLSSIHVRAVAAIDHHCRRSSIYPLPPASF
jgi:hypothetical protein